MDHYPHLQPYEHAARIYCGMIEADPDERFPAPHPLGLTGVLYTRPVWHTHAEALICLSRMLNALREASTQGH